MRDDIAVEWDPIVVTWDLIVVTWDLIAVRWDRIVVGRGLYVRSRECVALRDRIWCGLQVSDFELSFARRLHPRVRTYLHF